MSFTQLIEELEKLSSDELELVQAKLDVLQHGNSRETPELLAAVDEGLRSLREEGTITLEELEKRVASWHTKSS